jgi:hypothetical protein
VSGHRTFGSESWLGGFAMGSLGCFGLRRGGAAGAVTFWRDCTDNAVTWLNEGGRFVRPWPSASAAPSLCRLAWSNPANWRPYSIALDRKRSLGTLLSRCGLNVLGQLRA